MMMSAVGKKNRTAAKTHRLMEDVPLCAAAAIQRGPRTAAMLNRRTSQKPISRRSCERASPEDWLAVEMADSWAELGLPRYQMTVCHRARPNAPPAPALIPSVDWSRFPCITYAPYCGGRGGGSLSSAGGTAGGTNGMRLPSG